MTTPNTIIADMQLIETNLRQQIAHLNDEIAGLKSDVAFIGKERSNLEKQCDKYRKQVQIGFKHLIETPVITDDEIEEGYTAFEHIRMALVCALDNKEKAERQRDELLVEKQWISVSDKMPEDRVKVLCAMTDGSIEVLSHTPASKAVKYPHDLLWHGRGASCIAFIAAEKQVTHWMPLPDFPSANAKGEPC